MTNRQIAFLALAGYRELLTLWRFEPNGSEWFSNDILHSSFMLAFDRERNKLTIPEQMEISQSIGFKGGVARGAFDQTVEFEK